MGRALAVVVLVLLAGTVAFGQEATSIELKCPVDGHTFRLPLVEGGDGAGGLDSDQCRHNVKGRTLSYKLAVCPRCNYAALVGQFDEELTEQQKGRLLRALAGSRYRGVTDSWTEIPDWERFLLAAKCAEILGKEKEHLDCLTYAAWSARIEACRGATVAYGSQRRIVTPVPLRINAWFMTTGIVDLVKELENEVASAKTPAEKNRLRLHLVMMCQRAGFAAKRDAVLVRLKRSAAGDNLLAARVTRFEKLVGIETVNQEKVIALLGKMAAGTESRDDRMRHTYLLADTLRRLGRKSEAAVQFRAGRKLMTSSENPLRRFTDHFLTMLAPGEPLPIPEPEEVLPEAETPPQE